MDLLDLLGSTVAAPGRGTAKLVGLTVHHMNGAILAITWVYATALFALPANWLTGLLWGVVLASRTTRAPSPRTSAP
jgi:hypothetical protein